MWSGGQQGLRHPGSGVESSKVDELAPLNADFGALDGQPSHPRLTLPQFDDQLSAVRRGNHAESRDQEMG